MIIARVGTSVKLAMGNIRMDVLNPIDSTPATTFSQSLPGALAALIQHKIGIGTIEGVIVTNVIPSPASPIGN